MCFARAWGNLAREGWEGGLDPSLASLYMRGWLEFPRPSWNSRAPREANNDEDLSSVDCASTSIDQNHTYVAGDQNPLLTYATGGLKTHQ